MEDTPLQDNELIAYQLYEWDVPIEPASVKREWMSATQKGHAYHCLPLDIANQFGWVMLCTYDFEAVWNGREGQAGVKITYPDDLAPNHPFAESHFGNGIITFRIPFLFRTSPGFNLRVGGVPNYIRSGVQALEGIVETDWSPMTFTMNWKITIPNYPITFRKGEPFCMITPQRRGDLERIKPEIRPITANPALATQHRHFEQQRNLTHVANAWLRQRSKDVQKIGEVVYDKDYFLGFSTNSMEKAQQHQTKLKLKPFESVT